MLSNIIFDAVTAYIGKSSTSLPFINDCFRNLPFVVLLLLRLGDVETNPGPKKSSVIKFCHWNLNGLAVHDFLKVSLKKLLSPPTALSLGNVFRLHNIST